MLRNAPEGNSLRRAQDTGGRKEAVRRSVDCMEDGHKVPSRAACMLPHADKTMCMAQHMVHMVHGT